MEDRWRQEDEWNKQLQLQRKKHKQLQKKLDKLEGKVFQQKAEQINQRNNMINTIKPFFARNIKNPKQNKACLNSSLGVLFNNTRLWRGSGWLLRLSQ